MQIKHLVLLSGLCFLSACTTVSTNNSQFQVESPAQSLPLAIDLVSSDFINALKQLPDTPPANTTVALLQSSSSDVFIQSMYRALERNGYGTRWVEDGDSPFLLQYRKDSETQNKLTVRDVYEVAVGFVEMRRTYLTDAGNKVRPASPLYVRGTDASNIRLNDDIFDTPANKPVAKIDSVQGKGENSLVTGSVTGSATGSQTGSSTALSASDGYTVTLQDGTVLPPEANPLSGTVASGYPANVIAMPLVALPRVENVFELGVSNFEDVLAGYRKVSEKVMTFPNDSLRMGPANKVLIDNLVERFDSQQDLFSVVGCSLGPTDVIGGNAALALGRASRVVESLLFAGVPPERILDEGCWAGHSPDKTLPSRAVVLTLNRKLQ